MIPPPIYHYNMLGDVLVRNQIIRVPNIHDTYDTEEQVSVFIAIKIDIYVTLQSNGLYHHLQNSALASARLRMIAWNK